MKEIDINIEGYNVNGICVGCLNYNRKMFYRSEIQECFKNIADIDVPDGLSIQVCWECLAAVRSANRFREQILQAYNILIDYSKEHTFLNSPHDLSQYSTQRLTSSHLEHFFTTTITANDFGGKTECDVDVKSETEEKIDTDFDKEEPKEEGDFR